MDDKVQGQDLWVTDGTVKGTRPVTSFKPVRSFSFGDIPYLPFQVFKNRLFFAAITENLDREVWSTDGTPEGTRIHDLGPGGTQVEKLVWMGSRLFFSGGTAETGRGLWVWDGTSAPARRISGVLFDDSPVRPEKPVASNGALYFRGGLGGGHAVLWKSDGTEEGTAAILGRDGLPILDPSSLQAFAGRVYFLNTFKALLYQTEGTPEGTFSILDQVQSPDVGRPNLLRAGSRLFFSKWDRTTGVELWALEEN